MRRFITVAAVATLLLASTTSRAAAISAQPVGSGLNFPAAFTLAPDGRIFFGERFTGQIRILVPATGTHTLFFTVTNLLTDGERGLLGVALHPNYPGQPFVYVYATQDVQGSQRNQILRIRDNGGVGSSEKVVFSSETVAGSYHDGGRILFGPDRKLYAVVGEAHSPANAQNLGSTAGKILRMNARGRPAKGNPFLGSRIWSYGHRNSFGFAFDPTTGGLWETENGPECNDEINFIVAGSNYGWGPTETCSSPPPAPVNTNQDGPNPVQPLAFFTPTTAPVGAAFCVGCGLPASEGTLFFGTYKSHQILRVVLTANRTGIASITPVYNHGSSVLSIERGPNSALYFSDGVAIYKLIP
jgi:glucose/arabinose dehydrogenase